MQLFKSVAEPFLRYTCECCGVSYTGSPEYRAGLMQCTSCANGTHRHERAPLAA